MSASSSPHQKNQTNQSMIFYSVSVLTAFGIVVSRNSIIGNKNIPGQPSDTSGWLWTRERERERERENELFHSLWPERSHMGRSTWRTFATYHFSNSRSAGMMNFITGIRTFIKNKVWVVLWNHGAEEVLSEDNSSNTKIILTNSLFFSICRTGNS